MRLRMSARWNLRYCEMEKVVVGLKKTELQLFDVAYAIEMAKSQNYLFGS